MIDFHEDPSLQVKTESRKIAKCIIESHRDWKNDINGLKPHTLEKIDKIIKSLLGANSNSQGIETAWLET